MRRKILFGVLTAMILFGNANAVSAQETANVYEEQQSAQENAENEIAEICKYIDVEVQKEKKSANTEADENGFIVENGVLTGYTGSGGDIVIPNGVIKIGDRVFAGNNEIISVKIPESVKEIGNSSFYRCVNLKSAILPSNMTEMGTEVFEDCESLSDIVIPNGVTKIGKEDFYRCSKLVTVTLPENLTDIGDKAFDECTSLKEIKFPESLTKIGAASFAQCESLTQIAVTENVTTIGASAFSGCDNITIMTIPESATVIGADAFSGCAFTEITLPKGLKRIEDSTFSACSKLKNIVIPENVSYIGKQAFEDCESLRTLDVPDSVTEIGEQCFSRSGLMSIKLSENLKYISPMMMQDSGALQSIKVPKSVEYIDYLAFYGCWQLSDVTIWGENTEVEGNAFIECSSSLVIKCKQGSLAEETALEYHIPVTYIEDENQKKEQLITAENLVKVYGDPSFKIEASTNGNGKLSFESKNEYVIKVNGEGKASIVEVGTAQIVIKASETDTYKAAEKTIKITVKRKENGNQEKKQTITSKNITKTYGDKPFSINAKTDGGGKLTYKIENKKIAVINENGKVTLKGYGRTKITIYASTKGDYKAAKKTVVLTVKPKKESIASVKSAKANTITVTWKKDKRATGYIIQYSTDKKFSKKVSSITVSKNGTTERTIGKLKKGKKYYIRICAYKNDRDKRICGNYSLVKAIKVK